MLIGHVVRSSFRCVEQGDLKIAFEVEAKNV